MGRAETGQARPLRLGGRPARPGLVLGAGWGNPIASCQDLPDTAPSRVRLSWDRFCGFREGKARYKPVPRLPNIVRQGRSAVDSTESIVRGRALGRFRPIDHQGIGDFNFFGMFLTLTGVE